MTVDALGRHELFAPLNPTEMAALAGASCVVRARKGERLCAEGFPATYFFVLLKGRVQLRRPRTGGGELLVEDLEDGGIFGISSITGADHYLLNAECAEDSELLKLEGRTLRRILDQNPIVGYTIQKRVAQMFFRRYVDAMEKLELATQALLRPFAQSDHDVLRPGERHS